MTDRANPTETEQRLAALEAAIRELAACAPVRGRTPALDALCRGKSPGIEQAVNFPAETRAAA